MSKKNVYNIFLKFILQPYGVRICCYKFQIHVSRDIEGFLLRKNISNFAEATREKQFMTMTPLGMSSDVTCHRLWRHDCFSHSIQFKLIYFISIRTSQNLLKIRIRDCIRKRNKLFNHPLYYWMNNISLAICHLHVGTALPLLYVGISYFYVHLPPTICTSPSVNLQEEFWVFISVRKGGINTSIMVSLVPGLAPGLIHSYRWRGVKKIIKR